MNIELRGKTLRIVSEEILLIDGLRILLQRKNMRSIRLSVRPDGMLRVGAPVFVKREEVVRFVKANKAWAERAQNHVQEQKSRSENFRKHTFDNGDEFLFWGRALKLQVNHADAAASVRVEEGRLVMQIRPEAPKRLRANLLNAFFTHELQTKISELVNLWLKKMQERPLKQLRFRDMRSRWGSCFSKERRVCFNTRLVFLPEPCVEMIVVHELCHLKENSHNERFHLLMQTYLPDCKVREKELKVFAKRFGII